MDALQGITANFTTPSIGAVGSFSLGSGVRASGLNALAPALLGGSSAVVDLSGLGQLVSAAATFLDRLGTLQPGTATSGGGRNFGNNVASFAAEAQNFVDTFNGLQNNIASIGGTGNLLGGNVPGVSGLAQALITQAQANYSNGSSTLTNLSQIGIVVQPNQGPAGGVLSIDLNTLQNAFNSDAAGAFSLLSQAANSFSSLAGSFVGQAGSRFSTLGALAQTLSANQLLTNSILPLTLYGGSAGSGNGSVLQAILAINQYTLVSSLLG